MDFIKQYANIIKYGIGLILLLSVSYYIYDLKDTISTQKSTIQQLNLDIAYKDIELVKCKNATEQLNIRIEQFKQDSITNQKILDRLNIVIDENTTRNDEILDRLRDIPTPETCEEITKFVRENIGDLKWSK